MKLSEVARYWAAKELTRIERSGNAIFLCLPHNSVERRLRIISILPSLRLAEIKNDS